MKKPNKIIVVSFSFLLLVTPTISLRADGFDEIYYENHAWIGLGMYASEGKLSCKIKYFDKKSNAKKEGLRINDIITSIDGRDVHNLQDILITLKSKNPNDVVKVKVFRDSKEYTYNVTLINNPTDSKYKKVRGRVQSFNNGGKIVRVWGRYGGDKMLRSSWTLCNPLDGAFDSKNEEYEYTVPEILGDGNYIIEIKSLNKVGEKDAVYSSIRFKVETGPPSAPKNLTGRRETWYIRLDWKENKERDLAEYRLYRKDDGEYKLLATLSDAMTYYFDTTIQKSKHYFYKLTAFDKSNNESGYLNFCSFSPDIISNEDNKLGVNKFLEVMEECMKKWIVLVLMLVGLVGGIVFSADMTAQKAAAPAPSLSVSDCAFCKSVVNREPVDKAEVFPPEVGKVYFWTVITGAKEPAEVKHIWYYNNKKMLKVSLTIKNLRHRTWSSKTIIPEWLGDWKVDVVDASGNILKSAFFKIENPKTIK